MQLSRILLGFCNAVQSEPYSRRSLANRLLTVNRELGVLVRILNLCARNWRNEAGQPYLGAAPAITRAKGEKRPAYPISKEEENRLLDECPDHVRQLVLFALHTGARAGEITALRWDWLVEVPELGAQVFVLPPEFAKNGEERIIPLNSVARQNVDERRGTHPEFVFSWKGNPLTRISNSAWKKARRRADLPIRFHDLRHTFGHRLRAAGVSLEDRKALLGHTNGEITTHYSAAELETMLEHVESVADTAPSTVLTTGWTKGRQIRGNLPRKSAVLH